MFNAVWDVSKPEDEPLEVLEEDAKAVKSGKGDRKRARDLGTRVGKDEWGCRFGELLVSMNTTLVARLYICKKMLNARLVGWKW